MLQPTGTAPRGKIVVCLALLFTERNSRPCHHHVIDVSSVKLGLLEAQRLFLNMLMSTCGVWRTEFAGSARS